MRLGASWGHLGSVLRHLGASWGRLGEVLGRLGAFFDRPNMHPVLDSIFGSIFDRFWGPFGHHFEAMLGIMWGIGDIAKIIKKPAQGAGF